MSLQRNIGIFAIVFCMLVGSTWATVKFTCDYLLYQNATSTAHHWAQFLVESIGDLEQIAAGEQPSNASMKPIIVPAASVEVQGRVIGVLRKY